MGECFRGIETPNIIAVNLLYLFWTFTEYFSKENILDAIISFEFKWLDGQYTGGYTGKEPEIIEGFIMAVKQMENTDTTNNIYNWESTDNFAIDEQFAYISFPFDI